MILFGFQKTPKEAGVILDHQKTIGYPCIFFTSRLYRSPDQKMSCPCLSFAASLLNITPWLPRPHCWMLWLLCWEPDSAKLHLNSLTVCIS